MDESSQQSGDILHPHDSHGRFARKPEARPVVSAAVDSDPVIDAPLVSVSVNNPFKKILYWLNDIRKKQTTEFKLDVKIPLLSWIVLIVIVLSAFGLTVNISQYLANMQVVSLLAKASPKSMTILFPTVVPTPVLISRVGMFKATYQLSGAYPTTTPSGYVLLTGTDQIANLEIPPSIPVVNYLNKKVLVTGFYDAQKNTIQITKPTDLQFLP